jgi:hypothetical protein
VGFNADQDNIIGIALLALLFFYWCEFMINDILSKHCIAFNFTSVLT